MTARTPYQRILVPIDGSRTSDQALDEAIRLARLSGGQLRLLHVVDLLSVSLTPEVSLNASPTLFERLREGGQEILDRGLRAAQEAGVPAETTLRDTLSARVSDVVLDETARWPADLVVIGTHGRRGVGRFVMGSDAEQVVRSSGVPVLVVRGS
jgi:nucleotide-binding universal stress UspA family protein